MTKHSPRLFGFTLLELLVVISIIGILVAMGAASFSVAQKQGRDARRRADMKSYQNCMEQAYVVNTNNYTTGAGVCQGQIADPVTAANYSYGTAADAYCACADLDSLTAGNSAAACSTTTFTAVTTGTHFCVKSLQ